MTTKCQSDRITLPTSTRSVKQIRRHIISPKPPYIRSVIKSSLPRSSMTSKQLLPSPPLLPPPPQPHFPTMHRTINSVPQLGKALTESKALKYYNRTQSIRRPVKTMNYIKLLKKSVDARYFDANKHQYSGSFNHVNLAQKTATKPTPPVFKVRPTTRLGRPLQSAGTKYSLKPSSAKNTSRVSALKDQIFYDNI